MALVIFFVSDPEVGLSEIKKITKFDGVVAAYAWDVFGGGLPLEPLPALLRELRIEYPLPPSKEVSPLSAIEHLWKNTGLVEVSTTSFPAERTFENFEEYWAVSSLGPSVAGVLKDLEASTLNEIKYDLKKSLHKDAKVQIVTYASANTVKGIKK